MKRDAIIFDAKTHTYRYLDKDLSGITKRIGRRLGKVFPDDPPPAIDAARAHGTHVHRSFEYLVKHGKMPLNDEARFVMGALRARYDFSVCGIASEFLVSDYEFYATAIDIVIFKGEGRIDIYDIKTGVFDREYCSWQLGINKYFAELEGDLHVDRCGVIATRDKYVYNVAPKSTERVKSLLYGGRHGKERASGQGACEPDRDCE